MIITFWNIESRNEPRDEGTRRKDRKKEKRAEVCKGANDIQSADCVSSA